MADTDIKRLKIPAGEEPWVWHMSADRTPMFVTTSNTTRDKHTLYAIKDGKLNKLGTGKNPLELEEKYNIAKALNPKAK